MWYVSEANVTGDFQPSARKPIILSAAGLLKPQERKQIDPHIHRDANPRRNFLSDFESSIIQEH